MIGSADRNLRLRLIVFVLIQSLLKIRKIELMLGRLFYPEEQERACIMNEES